MSETQEKKVNPVKSLITGGFGGICNVLVGHPLDTIKVRLQTMPKPEPGQKPMYRGTFDCAAKTIKNEGVQGLYKGMSAPLTGVVPIFAVSFASYNLAKRLQQRENHKLTYWQIFLSGAFSGIVTMFIMAPGERIKCLLQVQQGKSGPQKYKGMMHCAKVLYKEGGIRSIYKGSCATLLRDMPATGMYFFTYEFLQDMAKKRYQNDDIGVYSSFFAGGAAGMSFWILGMPADVLKSRLQTSPEGKYPNGVRSVFKELIREDGVMALYRGVTPVMLRAFPANAACFFGIELDIPGKGMFFSVYEYLKEMEKKIFNDNEKKTAWEIVAGGVAGMGYWTVALPADVLKSRLQTAPEGRYKYGARSVYREMMRRDGPLSLFRGLNSIMVRAFPANAACMFVIGVVDDFLEKVAPDF